MRAPVKVQVKSPTAASFFCFAQRCNGLVHNPGSVSQVPARTGDLLLTLDGPGWWARARGSQANLSAMVLLALQAVGCQLAVPYRRIVDSSQRQWAELKRAGEELMEACQRRLKRARATQEAVDPAGACFAIAFGHRFG